MPPNPVTRRRFLAGQAAAPPNSEPPAGVLVGSAFAIFDAAPAPYCVRYARNAMATDFQLFLLAGQDAAATEAALEALDQIDALEAQLSVYRDTSDVSQINRRAGVEAVAVEPQLRELLQRALALSNDTAGAYDVTSGPLVALWQTARRAGTVPSEAEIVAALASVGSAKLELDATAGTIRFRDAGVRLNLGGIGKGYALDRCDRVFASRGVEHYLWHGGRSSVLCRGSAFGATHPEAGWTVGVGHPLKPGSRLAEIVVRNRAVGTSGAGFQFFRHEGKRYGHILDPRTGRPAEGVFSVTVLAPTGAEADALSTAFYVLGFDDSAEYCARRPDVGFLMLLPAAGGGAIELATCGLDDGLWRLVD